MPDAYQLVEAGPVFAPLRYGLLSVAQQIDDPDPHWRLGTVRDPDPCVSANSVIASCAAPGTLTPNGGDDFARAAEAFRVYAFIECSPVGAGSGSDPFGGLRDRANTLLTAGEGRAVEHVVWTGGATEGVVRPHLAEDTVVSGAPVNSVSGVLLQTAATVVTTGAPVDVVEAIGELEGALAECYGGEGVIHVPRSALALLGAYSLVDVDGQTLRTLGGTRVAAYGANDRHGPTGVEPAAGQAWFYATGAVEVRRSPINVRAAQPGEVINRRTNTVGVIAERWYSVRWDCCHLAAQVQLGGVVQGAIGTWS